MKKTVLIVALAMVMVLALGASPAFAKYAGFSATTQYVGWADATSLASNNADAALMAYGPHNGYATTTIKCAVCHSVHRADTKLLNDGTGGCAVCHTNAYYGGTGLAAGALVSWKVTAGGGPHSSFCNSGAGEACHAGPHGVGASTYVGASSKLLDTDDARLAAAATANGVAVTTASLWSDDNMRVLGTDATCTRCHTNSVFGIISAGTTLGVTPGVVGLTSATGHRVIAAASSNWNANGTDFPSGKTGLQIAWKPVTYCASCHDLTDDNNSGALAFPHAINDVVSTAQGKNAGNRAAVWLTAGANSGAQSMAVSGYANYAAVGDGSVDLDSGNAAAGSTILDGICLKCHRSATNGIGIDF